MRYAYKKMKKIQKIPLNAKDNFQAYTALSVIA